MGDFRVRQMRFPLQTEAVEKIGHQDQKHQPARLPYLLGARPAPVAVGDVSGVRPAGATEPKTRQLLLTGWPDRSTN